MRTGKVLVRTGTTLSAAGKSDPGRQRTVNEDRYHVDAARGLFIVIDGVGGQAAGGRAADVALTTLRAQLEREAVFGAARICEAMTAANNEIHRLAATRPEWHGMACVATLLAIDGARGWVGHVGDARLYKLTPRGIEKVTRDHSPIGEREDAGELSEFDAMHHARRNEVYRDLGSDRHEPGDPDFIDVVEVAVDADSAFLLCSDGLTDLVPSHAIDALTRTHAGNPERVAAALVDAANEAGGKDNVTVVFAEGPRFAASALLAATAQPTATLPDGAAWKGPSRSDRYVRLAILLLLTLVLVLTIGTLPPTGFDAGIASPAPAGSHQIVVSPGESISAALARAEAGTDVVVEPGEYRDAVALVSHVRLVSRVPGGAILRLPPEASESDTAAQAVGVTNAAIIGFRIVGDATSALGTGVLVRDAEISIVDTDISGATGAALDIGGASVVDVMASDVHDNPGAALALRPGASARITHNVFERNGTAAHAVTPLVVGDGAGLTLAANVFPDLSVAAFSTVSEPARSAIGKNNWFGDAHRVRSPATRGPSARGATGTRSAPAARTGRSGQR